MVMKDLDFPTIFLFYFHNSLSTPVNNYGIEIVGWYICQQFIELKLCLTSYAKAVFQYTKPPVLCTTCHHHGIFPHLLINCARVYSRRTVCALFFMGIVFVGGNTARLTAICYHLTHHHRAGRAMKIPYGLSNFAKVITEDFVYVDKTAYIAALEADGQYHFLLRSAPFR